MGPSVVNRYEERWVLLADAILRVLQSEALVEGDLDACILIGCDESPHQHGATWVDAGEVRAVKLSLSLRAHTHHLLMLRLLHHTHTHTHTHTQPGSFQCYSDIHNKEPFSSKSLSDI